MTPKEAIAAARNLLKQYFAEEAAPETTTAKLKDGTEVKYTALEAGASLFMADADGNQVPAPAADYELEDGTVLVVTEPGIIAEVKPPATEESAKPEAMAEEPAPADPAPKDGVDWTEEIKWIKASIASVAKQVATLSAAMQMFQQATGATFASMLDVVEASAEEVKEPPIKKPMQTVFGSNKGVKETALDKMKAGVKAYNEKLSKQQA